MNELIFISPIYKKMVWGGNNIQECFPFKGLSDHIGEVWCVVANAEDSSLILNGQHKGLTLTQYYQENRKDFGDFKTEQFPILIKIIDAEMDLSIQVHPKQDYALANGYPCGKDECWLVINAKQENKLILGHISNSKEVLVNAINEQKIMDFMKIQTIKRGDFINVPAGTVHAICAGTMIYEVQQNATTTFRLYDYDRVGFDGHKRELHIDQALDNICFPDEPKVTNVVEENEANYRKKIFLEGPYFDLIQYEIIERANIIRPGKFALVGCLEGEGLLNDQPVRKGDHAIILNHCNSISVMGNLKLIFTIPKEV
jgi:mannose-6-phosphate isomerase